MRHLNPAISNYARLGGDNLDLLLVHKVLLEKVCRASGVQFDGLSERDKRDLRWNLKEAACQLKERLCKKATEERQKSKFANPLFQPSVTELVDLANLERRADEPERALDILQRLQARLKKLKQPLPASAHNILGLCYGKLGRRILSYENYRQASEVEPADSTTLAIVVMR